jgi:PAS domain-containing protein
MKEATTHFPPNRVSDLVALQQGGNSVRCNTSFEILPVDFVHWGNPFQAYIFLCRYNGTVNDKAYSFRKCYARGCPHNRCPHVSQAVMIANRYLQRDYYKLEQAGIEVEKSLFTLEEMTVKFYGYQEEHGPILAIHDYINIAGEGTDVKVDLVLEFVSAVEHFAKYENRMIFLMVNFTVTCLGRTYHYERCLACHPQAEEDESRKQKILVANERLRLLYDEFDRAAIDHEKRFFQLGSNVTATSSKEPLNPEDKRLLLILNTLLLGVIIINPREHRIVYVNSEAARMMGRPQTEMLNQVCHNYICPFARGKCPITDLGQQIDRSARCVIDSTGAEVPILKSVKRIRFMAQDHLLETFMDNRAVAEKERLVGVLEMAGAAAHNLSQPLQALMFDLDDLNKKVPQRWSDKLKTMQESAEEMRDVIRNIQAITRYQTREYVHGARIVDIDSASAFE